MKKKALFLLVPLMSVTLSGCAEGIKYQEHLDDYVRAMKYHENFNILQLTDIHWNANTSTLSSKQYLSKTIAEADAHIKATYGNDAKIDLVELTGDLFMLANAYHVRTFVSFFEEQATKYGFTYAVIWGKHDRHGLYNPNWLGAQFANAAHGVYIEPDDNLYGRSNFVINLTTDGTKEAATKWQIVNIDSGASFSETAISPFRDYDYIRDDQVDWWRKEHDKVGDGVPAIAYYHIPQDDNLKAWNAIHKDGAAYKHKFFKLEGFADNGNERYASKFIKEGRNHNLKAAFMGHAHNVDWTVDYDGVVLGITENFDLIGASLVTIKNETTFALEHLYLNERADGDFIKWVKW